MEDEVKTEIITQIKNYLSNSKKIDATNFDVKINQIDGMTNKNFHVIVQNPVDPTQNFNFLYRIYGSVLENIGHETELIIMNYFLSKNLGAEVLVSKENFRIEKYLCNTMQIPLERRYNSDILENIYKILSEYPLISNIYKYNISNDNCLKLFNISENLENKNNFEVTIFDYAKKLLVVALKNFEVFKKKFVEYFKVNEKNEYEEEKLKKFENYLNNYKKIFYDLFPKNGVLVLSHNDCHRWNFLVNDIEKKLFIIDHEYAAFNLPGFDLCNYMNENSFYFDEQGNYKFKEEEIDVDFYYESYLKFCKHFIEKNSDWCNKSEVKEFLELMQSKKYYCKLHTITNVFWFLFCVINLDFENEFSNNKDNHYFQYGYDRLIYAEKMRNYIKED